MVDMNNSILIYWRAKMKTLVLQARYRLMMLRCVLYGHFARQKGRLSKSGMLVLPLGGRWDCEAGVSKLALTLIITGVSVGLAVAVFAILGDKIMALARNIGVAIEGVDPSGGTWGE
jgi:hypothetical protein